MSEAIVLLDTPTKSSLQAQSAVLRATLKDFERSFAVNNEGRKPSKSDIKSDATIAAQYKQYNKVRDVLSGKLSYETFLAPPESPSAKRSHRRVDSAVSWTPRKPRYDVTPRKNLQPFGVELDGSPSSFTPKPLFLSAIGPTPQRDGMVMGLFDLLTNSAKSSQATPSANRKRKLDDVYEHINPDTKHNAVAQTPKQKKRDGADDLLQHLTGTPETGRRKHSRTPVSDGKKFMLSQFFATPSTVRYSQFDAELGTDGVLKTPLRNHVMGLSPEDHKASQVAPDATPAYLRRSSSFKDRLMSAAEIGVSGSRRSSSFMSLAGLRQGPPNCQQFKTAPKPLSQIVANLRSLEDGEHDDDLEAIRELEDFGVDTLVGDSQNGTLGYRDGARSDENADQPMKTWKKRGQKRTTRRSKMRPTTGPIADAPKFVAAEDDDEDNNDIGDSSDAGDGRFNVTKTQLGHTEIRNGHDSGYSEPDEASDYDDQPSNCESGGTSKTSMKSKTKDVNEKNMSGSKNTEKQNKTSTAGRKAGTYNPNAQSHMNYRTLKIRNKNSKARGAGRGRFGRRR